MIIRLTLMCTVLLLLLFLAACMNLATSTSTSARFFLLEPKTDAGPSVKSTDWSAGISLGIGPVTIPTYLDRPQLVSRLDVNELQVDEFHRWAEPLRHNITRVIAENLSALTAAKRVHSFPKKRSGVIDLQISVDVLRFEADTAGIVTLRAIWRIINPDGHQQLVVRPSTIVQPSGRPDPAAVVDAMSEALAALSREIAQARVDVGQEP